MKTPRRIITGIMAVCWVAAAAMFAWTLREGSAARSHKALVRSCEQRVHRKMQEAFRWGEHLRHGQAATPKRTNTSAFYFENNRLQAWTPADIAVSEQQLSAIDTTGRLVQLGYVWYVACARVQGTAKIVAAVPVKKTYAYENEFLPEKISGFLQLPATADILPPDADSPYTVHSMRGTPLFTVVFDETATPAGHLTLRWLAVLLAAVALLLTVRLSKRATLPVVLGLAALRALLFCCPQMWEGSAALFSSAVYAHSVLIPSLGALLLHAVFIFLTAAVVWRHYRQAPFRRVRQIVSGAAAGCLLLFTHYAWQSLILNSTIPLDLSQLDRLTLFTFVAYGILMLLFAALYLLLRLFGNPFRKQRHFRWKPRVWNMVYVAALAVYTLAAITHYTHRREEQHVTAWVDRLLAEHDPTAELLLCNISTTMANDELLQAMVLRQEPADALHRYLQQHYFTGYLQYYDLQLTVCPHGGKLQIDTLEIDCRTFFARETAQYGTPLADSSVFYYLSNDNGRHSYLGHLYYRGAAGEEYDVYLEIDSKLHSGGEGYPELLMAHGAGNRLKLPAGYSAARYADGRLIAAFGDYRYPYDNNGFFYAGKQVENGFLHRLFHADSRYLIVISRATRTLWSYLILCSYLLFAIALSLLLLLAAAGMPWRRGRYKNTIQQKITVLLILSFAASILCIGAATLWYNVWQFRKNAMEQMQDKMHTVLTQLDYSLHDNGRNELFVLHRHLVQLSNSLHADINLYDTTGRLFVSSRMEIFDRHLQSERMNRPAYEQLHRRRLSEFSHKEQIGTLAFYSLYATYYNLQGKAEVYVNIPYFSKRMKDVREASAVVTAMVNVYVLALFAALLLGAALANRLLRPLEVVRRHLQRLDLTRQLERIRYDEKDELGDLIRAYNQMVSALEESTRQLAQSERESAWREMARQIAHEIKNPLTPMRLSIQHLVRLKKDGAPDWQQRFDALATALLEQIDTLTRTASAFSAFAGTGTNADRPVPVSLNRLLHDLRPLFDVHKTIAFEWCEQATGATVDGHPDHLQRVLVNLLTNSVQAVQEQPRGHIRVTLFAEGELYAIRVEDNGRGVPAELQAQLFTPNFTTKSSGTGLGLAICKKIAEDRGGRIAYSPSALGGAGFTVYFPR